MCWNIQSHPWYVEPSISWDLQLSLRQLVIVPLQVFDSREISHWQPDWIYKNSFEMKMQSRPDGKPDTRWGERRTPVPAEWRLNGKIWKEGFNLLFELLLFQKAWLVTCIFLMWFAWQTPWKTSGMQTGGTKCLSATLEYVVVMIFNALPPVSQTYSLNMRRETGTVRPRCVRWFEGLPLVFLPTRLLSHPRSAWVASSLNDHTPKELPT